MVRSSLLSQYVKKNERLTIGNNEQATVSKGQPGGTPPIIHIIQGGLVDQHWESKHRRWAMIQEASNVEKIGIE